MVLRRAKKGFFGLIAKGRSQMKCRDAKQKLNAWVDGELPEKAAARLSRHLEVCPSCAREAKALQHLAAALARLPAVPPPAHLSQTTLRRYRREMEKPGLVEWWRGLGLLMRGAVCSAATGGLVLGVGLGSSLTALQTTAAASGLISIVYHTGGILP
jgi:anti-sigma factor RsiW